MISQGALQKITESVYNTIKKCGLDYDWIVPPTRLAKQMTALRFAQFAIRKKYGGKKPAPIVQYSPLPRHGYLSWLLVRPFIGIAFDKDQEFGRETAPENTPVIDVQIARTILHECGHLFSTDELLSSDEGLIEIEGITFTKCSSPEQEEKAWVWAMCAFGLAMGHYAWKRRDGNDYDDTPKLLI